MRAKTRQTKIRVEKTGLSIDDVKKLDNLYLKGTASFGNAKRLQNLSKFSMKKVKCIWKRNHPSANIVHVASDFQGLKQLLTT